MLDITEGGYKRVHGEGRELETRVYAACGGEGTRGACCVCYEGVEGGLLGTTWNENGLTIVLRKTYFFLENKLYTGINILSSFSSYLSPSLEI